MSLISELWPISSGRCRAVFSHAISIETAVASMVTLLRGADQLGFTGIYGLYSSKQHGGLIHSLVQKQGVAVLAWDMTGMGARQTEGGETFYRRFPAASRLGAMIGEIESALDFIHCSPKEAAALPECSDGSSHTGPYERLVVPALDETKVFLLGYSMGSIVGLHAAAMLGSRIAGVAAFAGWTPFRSNGGVGNQSGGGSAATGGNKMLYSTHALLPRLGLFEGNESAVPYDYAELIAAIAPRSVLLHSPMQDRFASPGAVAAAAKAAQVAWHGVAASKFIVTAPDSPSNFEDQEVAAALRFAQTFVH
eukprot:SAG11_NODE_2579_length_3199_cov_13.264194_3_plen_308_part_00